MDISLQTGADLLVGDDSQFVIAGWNPPTGERYPAKSLGPNVLDPTNNDVGAMPKTYG